MHSEGPLSTRLLGPRVHPNRVLCNGPGPAPRPGGRGSCLCLWFCDGPLLSRPAPLRAQAPSPAVSPARRLLSVGPSATPRLCFCELRTCPQCSSLPPVVSALGGEEGRRGVLSSPRPEAGGDSSGELTGPTSPCSGSEQSGCRPWGPVRGRCLWVQRQENPSA